MHALLLQIHQVLYTVVISHRTFFGHSILFPPPLLIQLFQRDREREKTRKKTKTTDDIGTAYTLITYQTQRSHIHSPKGKPYFSIELELGILFGFGRKRESVCANGWSVCLSVAISRALPIGQHGERRGQLKEILDTLHGRQVHSCIRQAPTRTWSDDLGSMFYLSSLALVDRVVDQVETRRMGTISKYTSRLAG